MLLDQTVTITLNNKTIKYYENLGYKIPRRKDNQGRYKVATGTKILIDIKDALPYTHEEVWVKCDYCGEEYLETYANYTKCHNLRDLFKDACENCKGEKQKEINMKLYGKTHPNKYEYSFIFDCFTQRNYLLKTKEEDYNNTNDLLEYICLKHIDKGIRTISWNDFYRSNKGCMDCWRDRNKKEGHCNWNPNKTDEERQDTRKYIEYQQWRKQVFERDNYTCQCCGDKKGGNLNAHHISSYTNDKDNRLNIDNGITLCDKCHILDDNSYHKVCGVSNSTKDKFIKWINNYGIFNKVNIINTLVTQVNDYSHLP